MAMQYTDGRLAYWRALDSEQPAHPIPGLKGNIWNWELSSNGQIVLAQYDDGQLLYWRIQTPDQPAQPLPGIEGDVCTVYAYARMLQYLGVHVVSCDELTAIQALERAAPT